jgi:hypothetical protein
MGGAHIFFLNIRRTWDQLEARPLLDSISAADKEIDDIKAEANKLVDKKKKPDAKDEVKWAPIEIRVPVFDKTDVSREMVVVQKNAHVGDMMEPGKSPPLFKLADISRLEIWAHRVGHKLSV